MWFSSQVAPWAICIFNLDPRPLTPIKVLPPPPYVHSIPTGMEPLKFAGMSEAWQCGGLVFDVLFVSHMGDITSHDLPRTMRVGNRG